MRLVPSLKGAGDVPLVVRAGLHASRRLPGRPRPRTSSAPDLYSATTGRQAGVMGPTLLPVVMSKLASCSTDDDAPSRVRLARPRSSAQDCAELVAYSSSLGMRISCCCRVIEPPGSCGPRPQTALRWNAACERSSSRLASRITGPPSRAATFPLPTADSSG
jgi:hypothetical protein